MKLTAGQKAARTRRLRAAGRKAAATRRRRAAGKKAAKTRMRRAAARKAAATRKRSQPAVTLLSNGSYGVMITSACAGFSTWRDLDVTRWREDTTRDCWGQLCYVRDLSEESAWTIGMHLLSEAADESAFEFHPGCAEFRRQHGDLEVQAAVYVVP